MIIEIKGAQFANQGAHLMLRAVLERLHARLPEAEIALAPNPNSPYRERARLGAWQKLPLRRGTLDLTGLAYHLSPPVNRGLERYGIVTEARVDAVLDISGFAYGERWGSVALRQTAGELERCGRRHKPYLFLPQAFGPFPDGEHARRFGMALTHAALLCARDEESAAHLARLNPAIARSVVRCPDLTIAVQGDAAASGRWSVGPSTVLIIPNVRMLDSGPDSGAWQAGYLTLLQAVCAECQRRGREARIVNHAGREDARICTDLARACGAVVIDERDPLALKGLIGAAAAVVSSRYHGCVNALSQGVPCLGTSWSHKYRALFDDFGLGHWLLTKPDAAEARRLLGQLLDGEGGRPAPGVRDGLAARIDRMWDDVFVALSGEAAQ